MTTKRIVLVEWYWVGHHPTYFAHFILALEELGADVLAICPQPDETRQTLANLRRQRGLGPAREGQTVHRKVETYYRRFLRVRPARLSAIDWTLRHFRTIERQVKQWQADSGKPADLIFYSCICDLDFEWIQSARRFLSLPWMGLYLQPMSLRMPGKPSPDSGRISHPEKFFRGPLCQGAAVLDEGRAAQFAEVIGKPVTAFPDFTDERLPAAPEKNVLENRLRQFAAGRPVVGLFGYLRKSKGVLPWALASRHPGMSEICFALGGELLWDNFSAQETEVLVDVLTNGKNIWSHLLRIPDEEHLNSVLSACDIIYAAYLDFPHSSNIMAKAALLKKPMIVSDGYLMAERVRRFRMGEVVPQGDGHALAAAITKITANPEAWVEKNQPRWEDYHREHSYQRLKEVWGQLLSGL